MSKGLEGNASQAGGTEADFAYPERKVVGVIDRREQVRPLLDALRAKGFAESDVHVAAGSEAADALRATTGRGGYASLATRFMNAIGATNEETEIKSAYEAAMRDGRYVIAVDATDDDRKQAAADAFKAAGAHTIVYFGKFTLSVIAMGARG